MDYPPVSVVMPVRNEERHLAESVRHVLGQDYPGPLELVLAVGPSADRTEQIARDLQAAEPRITVVANPSGKIPAALNLAVRIARHQVIARIDGHALFPPGYLRTAVAVLAETGAADVGGVMAAEGETPVPAGRGVGHDLQGRRRRGRLAHRRPGRSRRQRLPRRLPPRADRAGRRLGRGDAPRRGLGAELPDPGPRRPGLVHPRAAGHLPAAGQPAALGAQYFHYGRWRRVVVREHPETASFRYLAPPGAAALIGAGPGRRAGRAGRDRGRGAGRGGRLTVGLVIPLVYLAGITAVSAALSRGLPAGVRARLPLVLAVMHMCWGTGFLTSPRRLHRGREADTRVRSAQKKAEGAATAGRE